MTATDLDKKRRKRQEYKRPVVHVSRNHSENNGMQSARDSALNECRETTLSYFS